MNGVDVLFHVVFIAASAVLAMILGVSIYSGDFSGRGLLMSYALLAVWIVMLAAFTTRFVRMRKKRA
ncbi:MAG: hypothetical protein ACYDCK_11055 [Thermoplasmatota archaeon]